MDQGIATRSELIARRALLVLAIQGRDLLQDKREQLLSEFRATADRIIESGQALEDAAGAARVALDAALARDGPEAVLGAALTASRGFAVEAGTVNVMGVRLPDIAHAPTGRPLTARGYGMIGTTPRTDAVAERFEAQIGLILRIAASEVRVRLLAAEISKTTRRVNALEHVVIPRLIRERKHIEMVLEERERQDLFRLKRIKARTRHQGGGVP